MKKILIAVGILVILAVIVFAAVGRRKVAGEGVYLGQVTRGDVVTVVTGTGVIQPRTKVNVSSEIYGQIVAIPVKEGDVVRKGDLLVRIDPEKYRSEVDRLAANARVDRIAIESEEVGLKNLELEQKRAHELFKQGVVSSSELERADLAVDSSRIRIKSLKESVTQAEAGLSRGQVDLSKATIYAPMSGQVTQVNTEVGEQVIVGTTNIPGSVLMVISDMSEVLAEVNVDETEVVRLASGQKAQVTADAVEKTTYQGRVTEIRNTARKEGDVNVFGVKILLDDLDGRLRPGMTAKAKIEVERRQNVLRVPIQAVTSREKKKLEDEKKEAALKVPSAASAPSSAAKGPSTGARDDTKATKEDAKSADLGDRPSGESGPNTADGKTSSQGGDRPSTEPDPGVGGARTEAASARVSRSKDDEGRRTARDSAHSQGKGTATPSGATNPPKGDRDEIEVVYVVEKDVARAVPVKTGATDESFVEIQEGVGEGTTVVTGPYRALKKLKEGARVAKKDESESLGEENEPKTGSNSNERSE